MGNMTNEQLEQEKVRLSRRTAYAKTMQELDEVLERLALVRQEFEARGLRFIKLR